MISKESYYAAVNSLTYKKPALELKESLLEVFKCLKDESVVSQLSDVELEVLLIYKMTYPVNSLDLIANIIAIPRVNSVLRKILSDDRSNAFFKKITPNRLEKIIFHLRELLGENDEIIKLFQSNLDARTVKAVAVQLKRVSNMSEDRRMVCDALHNLSCLSHYYMQFQDQISRNNGVVIQQSADVISAFLNIYHPFIYANPNNIQQPKNADQTKRKINEIGSEINSEPKKQRQSHPNPNPQDSDKVPGFVNEALQHVTPELEELLPEVMSSSFITTTHKKIDIPELDFSEPDLWGFDSPKSVGGKGHGI